MPTPPVVNTPPPAPSSTVGVEVRPVIPAASTVIVEQDFNTYNERPRAVPAEIAYINVTASTTLEYTPIIVRVDASAGAVTITFPLSSSAYGRQIWIVKTDATANAVSMAVQSGDNLWRPAAITTITAQYGCQSYLSTFDGTNAGWQYVGGG
jgi:hypothetical protein